MTDFIRADDRSKDSWCDAANRFDFTGGFFVNCLKDSFCSIRFSRCFDVLSKGQQSFVLWGVFVEFGDLDEVFGGGVAANRTDILDGRRRIQKTASGGYSTGTYFSIFAPMDSAKNFLRLQLSVGSMDGQ